MEKFIYWLYLFKIASLILIPLLLAGIIYYAKKLKIVSKKFEAIRNWFGINPLVSISKSRGQWKAIEELMEENYQSSWKLAIIKADALLEHFLQQLGYQGKNFDELLASLKLRGYQNLEILRGIHQAREEILQNKNYNLSQAEAKTIVEIYKKFWHELMANVL